jgi:hypothetical protein
MRQSRFPEVLGRKIFTIAKEHPELHAWQSGTLLAQFKVT